MLTVALITFPLTALGGLTLALMHWKGRHPPLGVALIHGALGASSIVVAMVYAIWTAEPDTFLALSLGTFVLAALSGLGLFAFHVKEGKIPFKLLFVHAPLALVGYALLLTHALRLP